MQQVRAALATVPSVSRDLHHTLSHIDALSDHLQTLSGSLQILSHHATRFIRTSTGASEEIHATTLPRIDRLLNQLGAETRQLQQLTERLQQNPQMLLYGHQEPPPGPGEAGYRQ